MKHLLPFLRLAGLVAALTSALYGQSYVWLTEHETDQQGNRHPFRHGDSLYGPVHSDDQIAIMGDPVFTDVVSSAASDFWHGEGYNPQFLGPLPVFNAVPAVELPSTAETYRAGAAAQGNFYSGYGKSYFVRFHDGSAKMTWWQTGTPMDTNTHVSEIVVATPTCIFCEGPVYVQGIVTGEVTLACSGTMYITDNIQYSDVNNRGRWVSPHSNHTNFLGLVSESDIKIANTPANGRWNSNGLGVNQTNQNLTSVVISAAVLALGSFTFEQQNDPDSGYVCLEPCGCDEDGHFGGPDDRGNIYLLGSITQKWRGYVHRSNCTSTGYQLCLRNDLRLRNHRPPCFWSVRDDREIPDSVNFGNVTVGQTATDTAFFDVGENLILGSVYASYPYSAVRLPPYQGAQFRIPVHFAPSRAATFNGSLTVFIGSQYYQIPLRGRGIPAAALGLNVSPNPFNLTTTIRYSLPEGQAGKLSMFDILGRTVKEFDVSNEQAGEHHLSFSASDLATGVYFIRLQAGADVVTRKVLLLK